MLLGNCELNAMNKSVISEAIILSLETYVKKTRSDNIS
jgi:hypothetical protein